MNTTSPNARARAFALWAALAASVFCAAAELARRDSGCTPADANAPRGVVLHARGVVSFGRYELNLAFDSEGYPLRVSVTSQAGLLH